MFGKPLTPRQQIFVLEYLIDLNGTQAAIRAGYARSGAKSQAHHLLRRPEISAAIRDAMAERARRTGITRERVLEEYARIAFADLRLLADWDERGPSLVEAARLPPEASAIIAVIEATEDEEGERIRIATFAKLKALESLARIFGINIAPEPKRRVPQA